MPHSTVPALLQELADKPLTIGKGPRRCPVVLAGLVVKPLPTTFVERISCFVPLAEWLHEASRSPYSFVGVESMVFL